ncbi:MAG: NTPase KAP [Candidatus Omnitrophica bacterium]|nr:NTPase KAP [Candidatus Omnitrophota bacterium]
MHLFERILCKKKKLTGKTGTQVVGLTKNPGVRIPTDNPIKTEADDALGRARVAKSFAEQVLSLDVDEGVVVGVLGPWGSGKTSFINLARTSLEKSGALVVDFNPWMFSGAEQLVDSFFIEISAQLKVRPELAEIAKEFEDYGEIFSGLDSLPYLGRWIQGGRAAGQLVNKFLNRRRQGVPSLREKVQKALGLLKKPIVIVLDDIDRLTTEEIRHIFRLVRLTANFRNLIYIVAFDRKRVEQALEEQGIPGRSYVEKILQLAVDLPVVPDDVLNKQILESIDKTLEGIEKTGHFDEAIFSDVFIEVIRPLIRNMRDVRRYTAGLRGTVKHLEGQIALVDVLALEAVRIFLPDVFIYMQQSVRALTATSDGFGSSHADAELKDRVESMLKVSSDQRNALVAMIKRLFPAARRHIENNHYGSEWKKNWLRDRRVAHEDVLRLYFEGVIGNGFETFLNAEKAWNLIGDQVGFDQFLRSLDMSTIQDVISSLEAYEDKFAPEHVVPAVVVLLNLWPDLPERKRGMYEFGLEMVVGRVTYRLLRSLNDPIVVEASVRTILPQLTTLNAKLDLITTVGYMKGAGHKLVSESAADIFEKEWRAQVLQASEQTLIKERELFKVLLYAKKEGEPSVVIPDSIGLALAILRSARSETLSQSMGNRAVRRLPRLPWDLLINLFGSEDILCKRIQDLKGVAGSEDQSLIVLAEKYLGGWRPDRHNDD